MRAFLAFTSFKSHAWWDSPCWHRGPSLTNRASQQKTCLFHPAARESHPSRLRAAISSQVTASASRPPNFTFPSLPVRQWVLISHRMPARCSRPDNLTTLSLPVQRSESWSPVGRRRGAPGQTILLSLSLPVQHSKSWYLVGCRRVAPGQTILLFLSLPVQHSES